MPEDQRQGVDCPSEKRKGSIHFAKLRDSERLRQVLNLLLQGPHTTRQLQKATDSLGVTATISELKRNQIPIISTPVGRTREYSLPEGQLDLKSLLGDTDG